MSCPPDCIDAGETVEFHEFIVNGYFVGTILDGNDAGHITGYADGSGKLENADTLVSFNNIVGIHEFTGNDRLPYAFGDMGLVQRGPCVGEF